MASNPQLNSAAMRRIREEEIEKSSLFGDVIELVPIDPTFVIKDHFAQSRKNHMMIILMIRTLGFPLNEGQDLYVNIGNPKELNYMTILSNGSLNTILGVRESLDSAEKVYHTVKNKKGKGNGWERIYIQNHDHSYTSLSELIVNNFNLLGVNLNIVTDTQALAKYLLDKGWATEPYLKKIQNAAKEKDVKVKKAAKLNQSEKDGSSQ